MNKYAGQVSHYIPGRNQIEVQYNDPGDKECIHYVLWSGGCDSTLLLYELIEAFGAESVVAVSYKYPWLLEKKYQTEKLHREAFKTKMALRGHSAIRHTEFDIQAFTQSGDGLTQQGGGLPQSIGWLLSIPFYVANGSKVYNGAIKCDDTSLVLTEYGALFENMSSILERNIHLRLPYLHLEKYEVLEKLMGYDLYEEAWYCEMPHEVNHPCYECHPCATHLSALMALKVMTKDDLIRIKATREIDRINGMIEEKRSRKDEVILEEEK